VDQQKDSKQAIVLFNQAIAQANELGDCKLQAKATAGLASAWRIDSNPTHKKESGSMYEVAASLFGGVNEKSEQIDAITEASESYMLVGQKDKAIKCLEKFDEHLVKEGGAAMFTKRIKELSAPPAKKGWLF
jgi:hypothetical protein